MLILETDTRKNEEVETGEGEGGKNFILSPYHKCRLHTLRRFGPLFSKQVFYDHYYYYYYIMGKKERQKDGRKKQTASTLTFRTGPEDPYEHEQPMMHA